MSSHDSLPESVHMCSFIRSPLPAQADACRNLYMSTSDALAYFTVATCIYLKQIVSQ